MITLPTLSTTDRVFVGINDKLWGRNPANGKILRKSINYGTNWTEIYTFDAYIQIVIEFADGTLLVCTDLTDSFNNPVAKWYQSTDGGTTFNLTLTYTEGGVQPWSFDYNGDTVFACEYGHYPSRYVHRSLDKGATWTTVFTHPRTALTLTTLHIHKVHIDNTDSNRIWLSVGDGEPAKGMWYSTDNGDNWTEYNTHYQPVWFETVGDWVIMMQDIVGYIHRGSITDILADTGNISPVYFAPDDTASDYGFGDVSFYAGRTASNGLIFAGAMAYGKDSTSKNNKDAMLLVSADNGATWKVVKIYPALETGSSGIAFISKETSTGMMYIETNGPDTIEILDTNNPDLLTLPQTYFPTRSTLTIHQG
jgi:hypothetical protein